MLTLWASQISIDQTLSISSGKHIALWATMLPYRPADDVMKWSLAKPNAYFVKIGHGHNACPEICSGDKTYHLSAGGANQGRASLIVPQATMLFLADSATKLKELFTCLIQVNRSCDGTIRECVKILLARKELYTFRPIKHPC